MTTTTFTASNGTHTFEGEHAAFYGTLPAVVLRNWTVHIFDDCCHLWSSTDGGSTWVENYTPTAADNNWGAVSTQTDAWGDMNMSLWDSDWTTMVAFDYDYGSAFGVLARSTESGTTGTWTMIDPEPSTPAPSLDYASGHGIQNISGCYSSATQTILSASNGGYGYTTWYPRISTDNGSTWSDVTGLTPNISYARACFSQNAGIMYIKPQDDYIYKSTDGGTTWSALTNSPTLTSHHVSEATIRMRCCKDGSVVGIVSAYGTNKGVFYWSSDSGATWSSYDVITLLGNTTGRFADFGISADGQVIAVMLEQLIGSNYWPGVVLSTDGGATWTDISSRLQYPVSSGGLPSGAPTGSTAINVSPDGAGIVQTFNQYLDNPHTSPSGLDGYTSYANVSFDQGLTFQLASYDADRIEINSALGLFVSLYIFPDFTAVGTPAGEPNLDPLIGCTYRRVSAMSTEPPKFMGWHRHDFGHSRNSLTSISISGDVGGLLDHLDMVTTDGSNYIVEGFTQLFDEDDALTDGWFLDGALVPDSAYEDTVAGVTGIRFTGLWYLRGQSVTVCAFGLDLGDYTVNSTDGSVFVPYGSGTAPSSFDYVTAGAGAYLFTAAYIASNVALTAPRNGGVYISGGYMPVVVGYTFVSDGQLLRPIAPDATGTKAGPSLGDIRRTHYVKVLLHNAIGLQFGVDFANTLQQAYLKDSAGTQYTPEQMYSDVWRETLNDDYSFDSMISWRVVRPYPASVVSIAASIEGQDV